jgi:hypothetical protein
VLSAVVAARRVAAAVVWRPPAAAVAEVRLHGVAEEE